jgi:predicted nucleotidyltransferase
LIKRIVEQVEKIPGVEAVVLDGSRARGTHTLASDIDLGLYYDPSMPLDIDALKQAAAKLDDCYCADLVTEPVGWGPWINSGGWLTVEQTPVDLIYRDLAKMPGIIHDCVNGKIDIVYQPGHHRKILDELKRHRPVGEWIQAGAAAPERAGRQHFHPSG